MPDITKTLINSLEPEEGKRTFIWDSKVSGLGLVIQATGAMSWVFQYRVGKRSRRMTIAPVSHLAPSQARDEAKALAAKVARGEDPAEAKRARREALTVGDLCDLYTESQDFIAKGEKTRSVDLSRINRHLKPMLGTRDANKLGVEDAKIAMNKIRQGATAKTEKMGSRKLARVRGGDGAARKCGVLLKTIYTWAEREQLIKQNRIRLLKTGSDRRRTYVLAKDDYARVFEALDSLVTEQDLHPVTADLIRTLALTGARRGEIAKLRWSQVDLKKGVVILAEHKTADKTNEARVIGLPATAMEIIARQTGKGEELVFSITEGKPISLEKPLRQVREKAGLPSEFCLHTFRHSLATNAAESGASVHDVQALLGHKTLAMAARYVHQSQDKRAQLAQKYSAGVSALLTGAESGEVVKINE